MTGANRPIEYLSLSDLLDIAAGVIDELGRARPRPARLRRGRPQATILGEDAYPTFAEKAAALMHSIARNHALVDGNKRLAWSATRVFCLLNGRDLAFTLDEAEALVVGVAAGELEVPEIAAAIDEHLR